MKDYRIQLTDLSTGLSTVKGFDRASAAREYVIKYIHEGHPTITARYIGRKGSKMSQKAEQGAVSQ